MCCSTLTPHRQSLGHSPVFLLLVPLLLVQKGEQWGKRRNQAVVLTTLSLNFSGKASGGGGGIIRESAEMLYYVVGDTSEADR